MAKPGPAKKPAAVRVLTGNPGKRPIAKEPKLNPDPLPRVPPILGKEGKKEWARVARRLQRIGLMSYIDRALLTIWCSTWERWHKAQGEVKEHGEIIKTTNNNLIQNPYLAVANRAARDLRLLAKEFGLSPSARASLAADGGALGEESPGDLVEQLFSMIGEGESNE